MFYALVARGTVVLAEHTNRSGNFPTVTRMLLGRISPTSDSKMSYLYDDYVFHYIVEDGITYLCLADEQQKRRMPFLFLQDVKDKFRASYGERAKTAIAFAMNTEFSRVLAERMEFFNENPAADNFGQVKDKLAEVKDIMVQNIESVLARGEKIELLVDKSEQLNRSANKFQRSSKQLKNVMWWKNVKMWALITVIVIVLIWLISSFVCGFNYSKCGAS